MRGTVVEPMGGRQTRMRLARPLGIEGQMLGFRYIDRARVETNTGYGDMED